MPTERSLARLACLLILALPLAARPDQTTASSPAVISPAAPSPAANPGLRPPIRFVRVWPEWRDGETFLGIGEYFSRQEATGDWTILRSHPADRTGFYFLVHTDNPSRGVRTGRFVIRIVDPRSPDFREFHFSAQVPGGQHTFQVGLTGTDWAGKTTHPVAWQVEFVPDDGGPATAQRSFLWEQPA